MCFSPEASFTASAVVTTIGVIAYQKAFNQPTKVLALIPIFFGIQQFCEGFVWLSKLYPSTEHFTAPVSTGFLFFTWVVSGHSSHRSASGC
jgi:hypothetical protein